MHPSVFLNFSGKMFCELKFFRGHSSECLTTFPGLFLDIHPNVRGNSPECLATFTGMFEDISQNIWGHYPESLRIFPTIFNDIPRRNMTFPPFPTFSAFRFCIPGFINGHAITYSQRIYLRKQKNVIFDLKF